MLELFITIIFLYFLALVDDFLLFFGGGSDSLERIAVLQIYIHSKVETIQKVALEDPLKLHSM